MKHKICFRCGKGINNNSNYIDLITFSKGKVIHSASFHISCWGDYNQERVNSRITEMASQGLNAIRNARILA